MKSRFGGGSRRRRGDVKSRFRDGSRRRRGDVRSRLRDGLASREKQNERKRKWEWEGEHGPPQAPYYRGIVSPGPSSFVSCFFKSPQLRSILERGWA